MTGQECRVQLPSSRRIYDEPDEEASTLLEDAANNIGGLGTPVIKSIVEAIEDFVAPDRVHNKRR